jgi:catechol 2,3-dioxygenase-like lactoylglutathione lyase family enzyme
MASLDIARFSHVALNVNDLRRSSAFYRDVLGFEQVSETEISDAMGYSAGFLTPAGVVLELLQLNDASGEPSPVDGSADSVRLAFGVVDIGEAKARLAEAGVTVLHEMESEGIKMVFLQDPDGRTLELDDFPDSANSFAERHGR